MFNKVKDFFMPQDEYDEEDEIEEMEEKLPEVAPRAQRVGMPTQIPSKVVPITNKTMSSKMEILNFTMNNYEMTGEICNYIKDRKPVIVNMQQLSPAEVQRAVDYLTGACYALNGAVERIADNIFVFAPEDVHISPDQVKARNNWPNV